MSDESTLRMIREKYGAILIGCAAQFGHRPEVLAGIMMRETAGGTSKLLDKQGPEGRGDSGHGHGLMQIDDRSFEAFCRSEDWKDPDKNITFASRVLRAKRQYIAQHAPPMSLAELERVSIAAYNCGEGRVVKALRDHQDPDKFTAHGNYAACVLEFAEIYAGLSAQATA